jgi:patatin-like phospholipase/acyl hydrolase
MKRKVRVLSIDGGGIRGILPGLIVDRLEVKLQKKLNDPNVRISDMFDFFAGTSTGGILSLAYLAPGEENRPKLTAKEAVDIYLDRGDEIFDVSLWQKIRSGSGILD